MSSSATSAVRNLEVVRKLFERLLAGYNRGSDRYRIENIHLRPRERAVIVGLRGPTLELELMVQNRAPGQRALFRTASLDISYQRRRGGTELSPAFARRLQRWLRPLEKLDPGDIELIWPGAMRRLPVMDENAVNQGWSRSLFDDRFTALLTRRRTAAKVIVVVSQACAMDCIFCPASDREAKGDSDLAIDSQFEDLVHQLVRGRELGAEGVEFGGNDVLRFERVLELVARASLLGYRDIILQSPGQSLHQLAADLARYPGVEVHVPIYGSSAAVHDQVTGTPGSFVGLLRALEATRAAGGPDVVLHTIALRANVDQLEELMAFCRTKFDRPLRITSLRSNRLGESEHLDMTVPFDRLRGLIERHPAAFHGEFPLCLFPAQATSRQMSGGRHEELRPVHLYDLGLPSHSEDQWAREQRSFFHPDICSGCRARGYCPGILHSYADIHGSSGLHPIA